MKASSALMILYLTGAFLVVIRWLWRNPPQERPQAELPMEQYKAVYGPQLPGWRASNER